MLPWLTALLADPPCATVAAFTAPERSATLSAVHAAAFTTRKGHCPEYEQLHKDLSDFWGQRSPEPTAQSQSASGSPVGSQQLQSAATSKQQVCLSPEALLFFQHPES